jgi:hypothetical protein
MYLIALYAFIEISLTCQQKKNYYVLKSDIVPIEEVEDVELASILGCRVSSLMMTPFTLWVFYLPAYERQGATDVRWGFSPRFWGRGLGFLRVVGYFFLVVGCFGSSCVLEGASPFFSFSFYFIIKSLLLIKKKMKCLGFPLGASYKATYICNGIIEKMERQLARWEKKLFN